VQPRPAPTDRDPRGSSSSPDSSPRR
jgi:hypothetical protein